ncbi:hypothetical protein [Caenimonas koreensis]|uniref:Uncharacterized protein n=1 Tax=Caenimonas koreensis DSM 17982 TaxID=1121255 RepID=A0A844B9J7_9BURK|nr:hypothetical protein [Caenimonas koreensis]MRD48176.1 hypothetical protein [Caenimonas koreensis DSM 17982]
MDQPSSTDLLLIACELAVKVECRPQRGDGTDAAVYVSSGDTLARRVRAGAKITVSSNAEVMEPGLNVACFCWTVVMQVGAARKTKYLVWIDATPQELAALWQARGEAKAVRDSLPHSQRKKKPWGPL